MRKNVFSSLHFFSVPNLRARIRQVFKSRNCFGKNSIIVLTIIYSELLWSLILLLSKMFLSYLVDWFLNNYSKSFLASEVCTYLNLVYNVHFGISERLVQYTLGKKRHLDFSVGGMDSTHRSVLWAIIF